MAKKKKPKVGARLGSGTMGGGPVRKPGPTTPPYGSYDPSLDQQERAANRGLGDLIADISTGNLRGVQDYELGKQGIDRDYGRSLADLMTSRTRGTEDYNRNIAELDRSYKRLGNTQRQQMAASGNLGGASTQAARKRAENQAWDRAPIDTSYTRFIDDSRNAEARLGEDRDFGLGELALGFSRGNEDRSTQLTRAQRENVFYGQDINETRIDQAKQAGLLPASFQSFGSQNSGIRPGPARKPVVRAKLGRRIPSGVRRGSVGGLLGGGRI